MPTTITLPAGLRLQGPMNEAFEAILTPEALDFVVQLHRRFDPRRKELLRERDLRQARIDAGEMPDFLPATAHIRADSWTVADLPEDIRGLCQVNGMSFTTEFFNAFIDKLVSWIEG